MTSHASARRNVELGDWGKLIVTSLLTGLLTSVAWYVGIVDAMVTRAEVERIVEIESPYIQDRKLLITTLESLQDTSEYNRAAIVELRVEIANLNSTLRTFDP